VRRDASRAGRRLRRDNRRQARALVLRRESRNAHALAYNVLLTATSVLDVERVGRPTVCSAGSWDLGTWVRAEAMTPAATLSARELQKQTKVGATPSRHDLRESLAQGTWLVRCVHKEMAFTPTPPLPARALRPR
jgi:hypothetical protein